MAIIIDGKKTADYLCADLKSEIEKYNLKPTIAFIKIGNDESSKIYVNNKAQRAQSIGIKSLKYEFEENVKVQEVEETILELNKNKEINGILLQLPLPNQLQEYTRYLIDSINPEKDVDCLTTINQGRLFVGKPFLSPCTPMGVVHLIKTVEQNLSGKNVAILGRSIVVGKPLSALMIKENCTVTVLNSYSQNISEVTNKADILISAIGKAEFIKKEFVKKDAIVIDVGITRINGEIKGDVLFNEVKEIAKAITPVPGGVGPMTIACLMYNTVYVAKNLYKS